jgi:hypothetical protein
MPEPRTPTALGTAGPNPLRGLAALLLALAERDGGGEQAKPAADLGPTRPGHGKTDGKNRGND